MSQRNGLHVVLGIVGLAAWMLYILACRPSWSPDSSKILFPYCNPETKEGGVALFDRSTGAVSSIFVQSAEEEGCDDYVPMTAQWDRDGSRAIVAWGESKSKTKKKKTIQREWLHVLVLPVGAKGKTRHFKLRDFEADHFYPLAEVAGKLYVGGNSLTRLDLRTGRKALRDLGDSRAVSLINRDTEHIVYAREGAESSDDLEFGNLDQKSLTLHPLFVLKKADLAQHGVKEAGGFKAFRPHGPRIAMIGEGEKEGKDFLVFCTDSGLQKVVAPELPSKVYRLGNLEWALDGKTIYAMVVTPTEDKDVQQFSLGEIPADGGPARLDPIVRVKTSSDNANLFLQIALSPDGSTIATATAYLDEKQIEMADRGLFLVDLRDPERKVTKIPFPSSQKAGKSIPKE